MHTAPVSNSSTVQINPELLNKEYLQDFVDNAMIALHWVDGNGIIIWANQAELDMLGYSREEYIGHPIREFHADADKIADILERLDRNESIKGYTAPLLRKDGSICTVSMSSNVFRRNGEFVHTRCFSIDISDQIMLGQASESRYQQLVQHLPAALYTTDANGIITQFNKAAADLWGREPVVGSDLWCGSWKINKPDGAPLPLDACPMAVTLREGRPVWGEEILVIRPDGSIRHVAPFPQPIKDLQGRIIGAFNMLVDITEIRQAENLLKQSEIELRRANNSLEQKVQQRTAELLMRNEELKKKEDQIRQYAAQLEVQNKELEQFAYAASHDLKEPLRKIQFYARAVSENTREVLDERNNYYLQRVEQAAQRMQRLMEDILAYTKTASTAEQLEVVDLELLVAEFIQLHKEEIEQQQMIIRCHNLPLIKGISFQLKQLVDNLLSNAIKYRHQERACVIDISATYVNGDDVPLPELDKHQIYCRVSFADNGIGFESKYAEKIFEIFQRLHAKNDTSGSGIGLAICKKIAQNHGGTIIATGIADEGACFTVYLRSDYGSGATSSYS